MFFFRHNFDSTIIYNSTSTWRPHPDYRIISKKDDHIYFFTYKNPVEGTLGRSYPGNLTEHFIKEFTQFRRAEPDTNRFFIPLFVTAAERVPAWQNINAYHIWQNMEVRYKKNGCDVDDGATDSFYLIVKDSIRAVRYYEPEFFENCAEPDINRTNAIKTKKEFLKIFR